MMAVFDRARFGSETELDMADMGSMAGGLNLEGGLGLTGDVEVSKLTSPLRPSRSILRRTDEFFLSSQFRKCS